MQAELCSIQNQQMRYLGFSVLAVIGLKQRHVIFYSQNELSSPIAANFVPHFFWLIFSFLCYFLLIGIGQLDNDV